MNNNCFMGDGKICRLEQLLNQNQEIYKNLKQQLHGINESDSKITMNIDSIKPYTQQIYSNQHINSSEIKQQPTIYTQNTSDDIQSSYRHNYIYQEETNEEPTEHKISFQNEKNYLLNKQNDEKSKYQKQYKKIIQMNRSRDYQNSKYNEITINSKNKIYDPYIQSKINQEILSSSLYNQQNQTFNEITFNDSGMMMSRNKIHTISEKSIHQQQYQQFQSQSRHYSHGISNRNLPLQEKYCKKQYYQDNLHDDSISGESIIQLQKYLFIPFNKLYRSSILEMKNSNTIILAHKSKIDSCRKSINDCRIINGIKYQCQKLLTDQQQLIKQLIRIQDNKNSIAIVGGADTLKKKIHMGLIAYCYKGLLNFIGQYSTELTVTLSHQEVLSHNDEPKSLFRSAKLNQQTNRKTFIAKLQEYIEELYKMIRKNIHGYKHTEKKILRLSKFIINSPQQSLWNVSIISTNRFDLDFLKCLDVNRIVWSLNPLVEYHEQTKNTLQCMKKYHNVFIERNNFF